VPSNVAGLTFFIGSIFFTSAGFCQLLQSRGALDITASAVQFAGTLWFNLNTFDAMQDIWSTPHQQNLAIWTPDFVGSICFLVASELAVIVVCKKPWCVMRDASLWWVNMINLLGSVFFMISAIAAFVVPSTDELLDASIANSGTFLGAVCFLAGAYLLLPACTSGDETLPPMSPAPASSC